MDQNRPPYWLGEGEQVPEPPGAAVDLIRSAVMESGFNCPPTLVRLPVARLRVALSGLRVTPEVGQMLTVALAEKLVLATPVAVTVTVWCEATLPGAA